MENQQPPSSWPTQTPEDIAALADALQESVDQLKYEIIPNKKALDHIPSKGAVIFLSNRPNGFVNELVLTDLIAKKRSDVRVLTSGKDHPQGLPGEFFIHSEEADASTEAGGDDPGIGRSETPIAQSMQWLEAEHCLVFCPAKSQNLPAFPFLPNFEAEWHSLAAKLARKTGATVVPVYFERFSEKGGRLYGRLEEFNYLRGFKKFKAKASGARQIHFRVGKPIDPDQYQPFNNDSLLTEYFRFRTFLLQYKKDIRRNFHAFKPVLFEKAFKDRKLIQPVAKKNLLDDLKRLPSDHQLVETGDGFVVYIAQARQIPNVLREIGRLREDTFRRVGEGTGKSIDLDRFDDYYLHMFVWHKEDEQIVGSYRIGETDKILKRFGKKGLYTATLFKYRGKFIKSLGPALEMGRSFIAADYQESFTPFLCLWKGIGKYVAQNPRYKVLFGPVSISGDYHSISRQLMIRFLEQRHSVPENPHKVTPRTPWQLKKMKGIGNAIADYFIGSHEDIADIISDLEQDNSDLPPLLKQYLNLGGRIVGFNVDPKFNDALDGLIVVDLSQTNPRQLKFYMGPQYKEFLEYHDKHDDYQEGVG